MTPIEESIEGAAAAGAKVKPELTDSQPDAGKQNLIRSLNVGNAEALEARVRKELEDQGILSADEEGEGKEGGDEIMEELKRCQNELRAVSAHNAAQLRRVLGAAKDELVRQELRNRLSEADNEVMEAYQKVSAARSKKKTPSKKEREQAWKALKERELILKELESV